MARRKSSDPTELELLILKVLWERSPLPVSEVRIALADRGRDLAHTSVITTLNVMAGKGQVSRKKIGKSFLFSPRIARDATAGKMLSKLVDRVFDGSASAVLLSLFEHQEMDVEEVKELRRLMNAKLKEPKP